VPLPFQSPTHPYTRRLKLLSIGPGRRSLRGLLIQGSLQSGIDYPAVARRTRHLAMQESVYFVLRSIRAVTRPCPAKAGLFLARCLFGKPVLGRNRRPLQRVYHDLRLAVGMNSFTQGVPTTYCYCLLHPLTADDRALRAAQESSNL